MRPAAILGLILASAAARAAEAPLQEGIRLYAEGRYDDAIARFAAHAQAHPGDWRGWFWGTASLLQKTVAESDVRRRKEILDEAERQTYRMCKEAGLFFSDPLVKYLQGFIESLRGDPLKSYECLDVAIRAAPDQVEAYAEVRLLDNARRAYSRAALDVAKLYMRRGKFEDAAVYLEHSRDQMAADDTDGQLDLVPTLAASEESLGRFENAIGHLRRAIELYRGNVPKQMEYLSSIAMIHLKTERLDEGLAVLAEAPAGTRDAEILYARCFAERLQALRSQEEEPMRRALAAYEDALRDCPEGLTYRLVVDMNELILDRITADTVGEWKEVIRKQVERLLVEQERRPECPAIYWQLSKYYKLLGNREKEIEYGKLHELKRKEVEGKEKYDQFGRPRC